MKENVLKMREKFLLFVEFSMKTVFFLGFALLCLGSLQAQQAEALDDVIAEKPGLYADSAYQGPMNLSDGLDWIALNAQNNRVYTIVLESDQAASINSLDYSNKRVTVRLKASGGKCTVRADTNTLFETASFVVYPGVTFMLEAGVSLIGLSRSRLPLVVVQGGTFIMNGGTISGNAAVDGGGVSVKSGGTFTMNNGTISGNATNSGGGVWVKGGTFIMNGGIISGNSASGYGGGVYVDSSSTFIKSGTGGVIYGSNAPEGQANKARSDIGGHAVYSNYRIRNTTVWGATALDYTKKNASKDWQ